MVKGFYIVKNKQEEKYMKVVLLWIKNKVMVYCIIQIKLSNMKEIFI